MLHRGLSSKTAAGFASLFYIGITAGRALSGLIFVGLGCAPIYPSIIHSTPEHFGADRSQAMIGVQMACAYVGICFMPPIFGYIANHGSVSLYPVYLLAILILMAVMHEKMLLRAVACKSKAGDING